MEPSQLSIMFLDTHPRHLMIYNFVARVKGPVQLDLAWLKVMQTSPQLTKTVVMWKLLPSSFQCRCPPFSSGGLQPLSDLVIFAGRERWMSHISGIAERVKSGICREILDPSNDSTVPGKDSNCSKTALEE